MRVCTLLLAIVATSPLVTSEGHDAAAYANGDHSGGDYASVKAAQVHGPAGRSGGPVFQSVSGSHGPRATGGSGGVGLDSFGSALQNGAETAYQRGTAQVQARDRGIARAQEQANHKSRHYDNGDAGAARQDNQERRGQLRENVYNTQDQQSRGSNSQQSNSYDERYDQAAEKGQKKIDVNDKHGSSLNSQGKYRRNDLAANKGNKGLAASKNAFDSENKGFEKVDYGYKKNFDTNFNQRGGSQETVGQDNTHSDVFEVNQKDNRFSKGFLDAFRRSNDNNALRKESDWLSNAAQWQKARNDFGAADRLKNSAGKKSADWETLFDRRDDVFGHRDKAQDKAVREANDNARKEADLQKSALASASGKKGVQDSKYYGGGTFGAGTGSGAGAGNTGSNPIVGHSGAAGSQTGAVSGLYGNPGSGHVSGSGGVVSGGNVAGSPVKGREEGSGGNYLNQYGEKARQADNGGQKEASQAQSDAKALNDYSKGTGVNENVQVKGQRQGLWSKNQTGLRDALASGFNGANAGAAKNAGLSDRDLNQRSSNSNLEAANKNLQAQELDRVNYKRNQVDSNQRVRKLKKFYHDKNEDGHNNEALNYDRNQGNQETGQEQQAHKEAKTSYNNAAEDSKAHQQGRAYSNLDARQISLADAFNREKDNSGGWKNAKQDAESQAQKHKASADSGRQNNELDTFGRSVNNRNQQLWDKARKDLVHKDQGSQKDKSLDAFFQFAPVSSGNALGLSSSGGSSQPAAPPRQQPRGSFAGSQGHGPSFGGGSQYGGGSSFGGGFDSPLGGFMGNMGSSNFGQHSVRGSGGNSGGSDFFSGQWRRK